MHWSRILSLTQITAGDAAVALLKAGAETDKKDNDGMLAFELAPDKGVSSRSFFRTFRDMRTVAYGLTRSASILRGLLRWKASTYSQSISLQWGPV